MSEHRVPVTVITGFLGAGKTTLLNRILRDTSHGKRIAVVENEFSMEVGIENELVDQQKGATFAEVAEIGGGCLCCSGSGEFIEKVEYLLEDKRDNFDYMIVETTGLADPAFTKHFFVNDQIKRQAYIDGIVVVVDAKHLLQHLLDETKPTGCVNEALEQIQFADRILLNKMDLVTEEEAASLERRLNTLAPTATVWRTTHSDVEPQQLLDIRAFDVQRAVGRRADYLEAWAPTSRHDPRVSSVFMVGSGELDLPSFHRWMGRTLSGPGRERVYRVKGVLRVRGSPLKHILQGVHSHYEVREHTAWDTSADAEEPYNHIVLIGRNLPQQALSEAFKKDTGVALQAVKLGMQSPPETLTFRELAATLLPKLLFTFFLALFLVPQDMRRWLAAPPRAVLPAASPLARSLVGGAHAVVDYRFHLLAAVAACVAAGTFLYVQGMRWKERRW